MQVYLLQAVIDYEGSDFHGVFKTLKGAKDHAATLYPFGRKRSDNRDWEDVGNGCYRYELRSGIRLCIDLVDVEE